MPCLRDACPNIRWLTISLLMSTLFLVNAARKLAVVSPEEDRLLVGAPLRIDCKLTESASTINISDVFFGFVSDDVSSEASVDSGLVMIDEKYVTNVGPRTVQLNYDNVTADDGGFYRCMTNDTEHGVLAVSYVRVVRPPLAISNFTAVSFNFEELVVEWLPCEPDTNYTLFWTTDFSLDYYTVYHRKKVETNNDVMRSVWLQSDAENGFEASAIYYCFYIESNNQFGTARSETFKVYLKQTENAFHTFTNSDRRISTDDEIVKPKQVDKMNLAADSKSINVSWSGLDRLLDYMPLTCRIAYFDTENDQQTKDVPCNLSSVTLEELLPFRNYTVAVQSKPTKGGYWSEPQIGSITTSQSNPVEAPQLHSGWYRVTKCDKALDSCSIVLYWKKIPQRKRGGVIIKYEIEIRELSKTVYVNGSADTFSVELTLPATEASYWFSIRAYTAVGPSPYSHMFVTISPPRAADTVLSGVTMEADDDESGVRIEWNAEQYSAFANYTIFSCNSSRRGSKTCEDEPVSIRDVPGNETFVELPNVRTGQLFAVGGNSDSSSSGLTDFLCKYVHNRLPEKPQLFRPDLLQHHNNLTVQWVAMKCDGGTNTATKVLYYVIEYGPVGEGQPRTQNVSADKTSYVITDLFPDTNYSVSLCAVSRKGAGTCDVMFTRTGSTVPANVTFIIIFCVVGFLVLLTCLILFVLFPRMKQTFEKKYHVPIQVPEGDLLLPRHTGGSESSSQSSTSFDGRLPHRNGGEDVGIDMAPRDVIPPNTTSPPTYALYWSPNIVPAFRDTVGNSQRAAATDAADVDDRGARQLSLAVDGGPLSRENDQVSSAAEPEEVDEYEQVCSLENFDESYAQFSRLDVHRLHQTGTGQLPRVVKPGTLNICGSNGGADISDVGLNEQDQGAVGGRSSTSLQPPCVFNVDDVKMSLDASMSDWLDGGNSQQNSGSYAVSDVASSCCSSAQYRTTVKRDVPGMKLGDRPRSMVYESSGGSGFGSSGRMWPQHAASDLPMPDTRHVGAATAAALSAEDSRSDEADVASNEDEVDEYIRVAGDNADAIDGRQTAVDSVGDVVIAVATDGAAMISVEPEQIASGIDISGGEDDDAYDDEVEQADVSNVSTSLSETNDDTEDSDVGYSTVASPIGAATGSEPANLSPSAAEYDDGAGLLSGVVVFDARTPVDSTATATAAARDADRTTVPTVDGRQERAFDDNLGATNVSARKDDFVVCDAPMPTSALSSSTGQNAEQLLGPQPPPSASLRMGLEFDDSLGDARSPNDEDFSTADRDDSSASTVTSRSSASSDPYMSAAAQVVNLVFKPPSRPPGAPRYSLSDSEPEDTAAA